MEWVIKSGETVGHMKILKVLSGHKFLVRFQEQCYRARWQQQTHTLFLQKEEQPGFYSAMESCFHVRSQVVTRPGQKAERVQDISLVGHGGISFIRATLTPLSVSRRKREKTAEETSFRCYSPITGKIVKILARQGQKLGVGEVVMIIEAMKMENRILADCTGLLSQLTFKEGDSIRQGDELFVIEPT